MNSAVRRYMRVRLYIPERKRRHALDKALFATAKRCEAVKESQYESIKVLFNIQLFFLIAEKDFHTVKLDVLTHPNIWKRNLALRIALLTIHELDLGKVASADKLKKAFDDAGIEGELRRQMTQAMREINKGQSKARSKFAELRHSAIAHRDADALFQYRKITEVDSMEVMNDIALFYKNANLFIETLPKALLASSRIPALLKQKAINY